MSTSTTPIWLTSNRVKERWHIWRTNTCHLPIQCNFLASIDLLHRNNLIQSPLKWRSTCQDSPCASNFPTPTISETPRKCSNSSRTARYSYSTLTRTSPFRSSRVFSRCTTSKWVRLPSLPPTTHRRNKSDDPSRSTLQPPTMHSSRVEIYRHRLCRSFRPIPAMRSFPPLSSLPLKRCPFHRMPIKLRASDSFLSLLK
jgi:hypothetical protein